MDSEATAQKARIRAQFDTAALEYDAGPGCFAYFGKRLVESAEILPDHRVLDVATGRGAAFFPAAELLSSAAEIVGSTWCSRTLLFIVCYADLGLCSFLINCTLSESSNEC